MFCLPGNCVDGMSTSFMSWIPGTVLVLCCGGTVALTAALILARNYLNVIFPVFGSYFMSSLNAVQIQVGHSAL